MNTTRALTALLALTFLAAEGLPAQRRGTDGSGSGGRSTPSSGGSRGSSSSGGSSRSGGSSGGSSRGSSPSGSSGTKASGSTRDRDGGSQPAANSRGSEGNSTRGAETRRSGGSKIGVIRRDADRAAARVGNGGVYVRRGVYVGGCYYDYGCDPYWGWYGGRWGWYHGGYWYPSRRHYHRGENDEPVEEAAGQGYDEFPYAHADTAFVQSHTLRRRGYGAVTGQYFSDDGSRTQAGRFAIEGAYRIFRGELEYSLYSEPTATTIERMHSFRLAAGVQPRLGENAYLTATVGVRGIALNNGGQNAGGPEVGLGVQLLPKRPLGLNITGRAAAMTWNGVDYFALKELNTTGSIFVNRLELQAGWHWLKLGNAPAFGGPVAGVRVWF